MGTLIRFVCVCITGTLLFGVTRHCAAQSTGTSVEVSSPTEWVGALSNLSAHFETKVSYTPDTDFLKRVFPNQLDAIAQCFRGTRLRESSFSILGAYAMVSSTQVSGEPADQVSGETVKSIFVCTPERVERLSTFPASPSPMGDISQSGNFEVPGILDLALGLRIYGHREWLDPEAMHKLSAEKTANGCRVRLEENGHSDEWEYVNSPSFHLISYTVRFGKARLYQYLGDDFRVVGTAFLPFKVIMYYSQIEENGKPHVDETDELTVRDYSIGLHGNIPANYQIVWPVGSRIEDLRIHKKITIRSTTRPLDDSAIFSMLQQSEKKDRTAEADAERRIDRALHDGSGRTATTLPATQPDAPLP